MGGRFSRLKSRAATEVCYGPGAWRCISPGFPSHWRSPFLSRGIAIGHFGFLIAGSYCCVSSSAGSFGRLAIMARDILAPRDDPACYIHLIRSGNFYLSAMGSCYRHMPEIYLHRHPI